MVGNMMVRQQQWAAEQACMTGTAMPEAEVIEALPTTTASMRGYWDAVKAGGASAVSAHFHASKKSAWTSGGIKTAITSGTKITDPFALPGAILAEAPARLFRSGDGSSVRSQWLVHGSDGVLIGSYDTELRRSGSVWRLYDMTLVPANHYLEPLVQYCHKVGDVMPYRLSTTEASLNYAAKHAAKMTAKAQKAEGEAEKILGRMMNSSGAAKPGDKIKLAEMTDRAKAARGKADLAKRAEDESARAYAKAKADAQAMEDARAAAKAKLGL